MKILYVDDEIINIKLFNINFSKKYEVITALSGKDGLSILENNQDTDVIMSDMKMPGMSGLDFIRLAKEKYPNKRFYILTGHDLTQEIYDAIQSGLINKYFSKPFDMNAIEAEINHIVL